MAGSARAPTAAASPGGRAGRRPRRSWITRVAALPSFMRDESNATRAARGNGAIGARRPGPRRAGRARASACRCPPPGSPSRDLDPWFVAFGRAVGAGAAGLASTCGHPRAAAHRARSGGGWRSSRSASSSASRCSPRSRSTTRPRRTAPSSSRCCPPSPPSFAVAARPASARRRLFWLAGARRPASPSSASSSPAARCAARVELGRPVPARRRRRCAGSGYAEGGALARDLGGARDDLLGARAVAAGHASPVTAVAAAAHAAARRRRRLARLRLRHRRLDVPGLLRLVRRAGPRRRRAGSARSSSPSRCSPSPGRRCCWASPSARRRSSPRSRSLACVALTQRLRAATAPAPLMTLAGTRLISAEPGTSISA